MGGYGRIVRPDTAGGVMPPERDRAPNGTVTTLPPVEALAERLAPDARALAAQLAAETGRDRLDILLGLGALPPDVVVRSIGEELGLAVFGAAEVALIDAFAPAARGADALDAWLAAAAEAPHRADRRVLLGIAPRASQRRALAAMLAALPELAGDVRLIAPHEGARLVAWQIGAVPERAIRRAARGDPAEPEGAAVHRLAADPRVGEAEICRLIAARHGLRFARLGPGWRPRLPDATPPGVVARLRVVAATTPEGAEVRVVAPPVAGLGAAIRRLRSGNVPAEAVVVATATDLRAALRRRIARAALAEAVGRLARIDPALTAEHMPGPRQRLALAAALPLLVAALVLRPEIVLGGALVATTAGFIAIGVLRLTALLAITVPEAPPAAPPARLPSYSVLVALRDEAAMIPGLVAALERLRYPRDRLDIKIVLEADDLATRAAAERHCRAPHFDVIVVPPGRPATKPRALDHALAFCEGDIVGVFDAEDRPHPDQLLRAAAAFAHGPPDLGCVQARLAIDRIRNPLQAQFAIEYAALFEGLLPYFSRCRLPLPLGGTSNHFRRAALVDVGGWDAFNVTEDADLGIRLARFGWASAMLDSVTHEEAPARLRTWQSQRRRWIKGWMITWLVHMRAPRRLWQELGPAGFLAVQAQVGGVVVSALAHPAGILLILLHFSDVVPLRIGASFLGDLVIAGALVNVLFGYGASLWLASRALAIRGRFDLAAQVPLMPFYWLLVSFAAWMALLDLIRRPHHWSKTPHVPHDAPPAAPAEPGAAPDATRSRPPLWRRLGAWILGVGI